MVRPPRSRRIFSSRGNRANCRASAATKECRRFTNGSAEKKHNAILVRHPVLRVIQWYCYRSPLVLPDRSRVTSRGCLITPGCACTRRRPNASRRDVSLVSRLNVSASRATETNPRPPTASPSSAPPRLARSRSRTWTSARRTRRRPPSRSPRRTWSSCSCAGGGSPRTAAAAHPTRWRTATPRRGRRGLRVVLVFRENAFRMACSVNNEREERRLWTVRDAGSGAVASGPVTRDGETGT